MREEINLLDKLASLKAIADRAFWGTRTGIISAQERDDLLNGIVVLVGDIQHPPDSKIIEFRKEG